MDASVTTMKGSRQIKSAKRLRITGTSRRPDAAEVAEEEIGWGATTVQLPANTPPLPRVDFL